MIKNNIGKRTLALTMAAVMLASIASCGRGKNGAAVSESDTAPHSQKADDGLYYPVTKESFYDENGELSRCYEYAYSTEGYLLKERHYYVTDGKIDQDYSSQYSYDGNGRMTKQVSDYTGWNDEIDQWNYDRWTTTYEYDDMGRMIAYEYLCENYHMKERKEVMDESALTETDRLVIRSTIAYFNDKLTGGYLSRLRSRQVDVDGGLLDFWEDTLYDANGKPLWKSNQYNAGSTRYDEYQYDSKGRVTSQSTRYVTDAYISESLYSVEYDDQSRVIAQKRMYDGMKDSWVFFYNEDGSYAGCDETDVHGYVCQERCQYAANGELICMTFHHECEDADLKLRDRKKEYSDYDANGNCGTVTLYALTDNGDWELNEKHIYEYGDKIPKGVTYGTSQAKQEKQRLAVLNFDEDKRLFHEYLNR